MASLSIQDIDLDGVELTYTTATTEDTFNNNYDNIILFLKNTDTSTHTATLVAQKECNQGFLHDQEIDVSAEEVRIITDIDSSRFNDENNEVHITYDDDTMFEVAVGR
ncbi:MAG: hypothetical protein ACOCRK_02645 [bacterium]